MVCIPFTNGEHISRGRNWYACFLSIDLSHLKYSIHRKDIRHISSDDGNELEKVTSVLLRDDDESFKVHYKRVEGQIVGGSLDSKNTTSVLVSIRKTCLNSIVRTVWEGQFDDICHTCFDDLPSCVGRIVIERRNHPALLYPSCSVIQSTNFIMKLMHCDPRTNGWMKTIYYGNLPPKSWATNGKRRRVN